MYDFKEYSFLVKEDVQILHGDNFRGKLVFYKVLFGSGCYGLYKVYKNLIFSLENLKLNFME